MSYQPAHIPTSMGAHMINDSHKYAVQSVGQAFDLLEVIADDPIHATLPRLAETRGMSRHKAIRLLTTLCERGLVERDETAGRYQLGIYSVTLALKLLNHANVVTYAHPIMEDLARKHGEAVYMTVAAGDEVLFLDMVDCEQWIKVAPLLGNRFPLFTNAAGKVIKAPDSREVLEKIFRKRGKRGDFADLDKLELELQEIRNKGVAVDVGGLGEGIITVAVAVRDYAGKVVGAVTMLGPSFRMLAERLESEIVPSLIEGAARISAKFGYTPA